MVAAAMSKLRDQELQTHPRLSPDAPDSQHAETVRLSSARPQVRETTFSYCRLLDKDKYDIHVNVIQFRL